MLNDLTSSSHGSDIQSKEKESKAVYVCGECVSVYAFQMCVRSCVRMFG